MGSQQNELNLHLKVFENTQFPDEFLNTKLINLYCKHMIHTNLIKIPKQIVFLLHLIRLAMSFVNGDLMKNYQVTYYIILIS